MIKLASLPTNPYVAVATFPEAHAAVRTSLFLINSGLLLDADELLDHMSIKAINHSKLSSREWKELPTVFLKLSGSKNTVGDIIKVIKVTAMQNGCHRFEVTGDKEQIEVLWGTRKIDGKATLTTKKTLRTCSYQWRCYAYFTNCGFSREIPQYA